MLLVSAGMNIEWLVNFSFITGALVTGKLWSYHAGLYKEVNSMVIEMNTWRDSTRWMKRITQKYTLMLESPGGFCGKPLQFMPVESRGIKHKWVSIFINLSHLVYSKWTSISSELTFQINIGYKRVKVVSWFLANKQRECYNTI